MASESCHVRILNLITNSSCLSGSIYLQSSITPSISQHIPLKVWISSVELKVSCWLKTAEALSRECCAWSATLPQNRHRPPLGSTWSDVPWTSNSSKLSMPCFTGFRRKMATSWIPFTKLSCQWPRNTFPSTTLTPMSAFQRHEPLAVNIVCAIYSCIWSQSAGFSCIVLTTSYS